MNSTSGFVVVFILFFLFVLFLFFEIHDLVREIPLLL